MEHNDIYWPKLNREIEALKSGSHSIAQFISFLSAFNSFLWRSDQQQEVSRVLQFMEYELKARCVDLAVDDRLKVLNSFFFEEKRFYSISADLSCDRTDDLLVASALKHRRGHDLLIAAIYSYLGGTIGIELEWIPHQGASVVRWFSSRGEQYLDLHLKGARLSDHELLRRVTGTPHHRVHLESFRNIDLATMYLELMLAHAKHKTLRGHLISVLDILLTIHPHQTLYLAERALIRKEIGDHQLALVDLKRYFAFVNHTESPQEIQHAWLELNRHHQMILHADDDIPTLH